jgi:hypothetical protein
MALDFKIKKGRKFEASGPEICIEKGLFTFHTAVFQNSETILIPKVLDEPVD